MPPVSSYLSALLLLGAPSLAINARSSTPPMGWNSYNYYNCFINETVIKENAKGLVDRGFAALGYDIVTPDCGWPDFNRTANGSITWNPKLFPSGFPALGDYIHSLGLKFGLYSGGGVHQCGSGPGSGNPALPASLGYELQDAQTFASWGGDSLKYDNCWASPSVYVDYAPTEPDPSVRFAKMADALESVNRPIELEVCQWGVGVDLGYWAPEIANSWRISNDIYNSWSSVWRITNQVVPYAKHTGIGRYADMDMLIVGLNALGFEEERFHFSVWAINKSLLKIGAAMSDVTPKESFEILSNKEIIALNQDPLGEQAHLVRRYTEESYDIWAGNLSSGGFVVAVLNWANASTTVSVNLLDTVGIASAAAVRDVWHAKDLGPIESGSEPLSVDLVGHEAKVLVFSEVTLQRPPTKAGGSSYYPAVNSTLSGAAAVVDCSSSPRYCLPTKSKIANMTVGSSVLFKGITASSGSTKLVGVDYINYDVALQSSWSNGTNTRNLTLSVNGGKAKRWAFPISGGDWFETGRLDVELDGFVEGTENQILVSAAGVEAGPDVVGLEVYN